MPKPRLAFWYAPNGDSEEFEAFIADQMRAYAAQVEAATLERCAKACEAEHVLSDLNAEDGQPSDIAYNMALRHAAEAIRALGQTREQG